MERFEELARNAAAARKPSAFENLDDFNDVELKPIVATEQANKKMKITTQMSQLVESALDSPCVPANPSGPQEKILTALQQMSPEQVSKLLRDALAKRRKSSDAALLDPGCSASNDAGVPTKADPNLAPWVSPSNDAGVPTTADAIDAGFPTTADPTLIPISSSSNDAEKGLKDAQIMLDCFASAVSASSSSSSNDAASLIKTMFPRAKGAQWPAVPTAPSAEHTDPKLPAVPKPPAVPKAPSAAAEAVDRDAPTPPPVAVAWAEQNGEREQWNSGWYEGSYWRHGTERYGKRSGLKGEFFTARRHAMNMGFDMKQWDRDNQWRIRTYSLEWKNEARKLDRQKAMERNNQ